MKTSQILNKIRTFTTKLEGKAKLQPVRFFSEATLEDYPLGAELRPYVALLPGQ